MDWGFAKTLGNKVYEAELLRENILLNKSKASIVKMSTPNMTNSNLVDNSQL